MSKNGLKIRYRIFGYLLENQLATAYEIAKAIKYPQNTVRYNLKYMLNEGIVCKNGQKYAINDIYLEDNFIEDIKEGLIDIFRKFENTDLTAEGVLFFMQYLAMHTELKYINRGEQNGRDRG